MIDPNDLFSGMTVDAAPAPGTPVETQPFVSTASSSVGYTETTPPTNSNPPRNVVPVAQAPVAALPASSLGPLMTAAPIDPAPQPILEPAPPAAWDGYSQSYTNQQSYGYPETNTYSYTTEQPTTYTTEQPPTYTAERPPTYTTEQPPTYTTEQPAQYQQEQYHQDSWPDQGYQQIDPYAASNGYAYDNYSVPPPATYSAQAPSSQYPGYYWPVRNTSDQKPSA